MLPSDDSLSLRASAAPKKTAAGSNAKPGSPGATTTPPPGGHKVAKPSTASGTSAGSTQTSFEAHARDELFLHTPAVSLKQAAGAKAAPAPSPTAIALSTGASTTLAATTRDGSHKGARDKHITQLESQISDITTKQGLLNSLPAALPGIGFLGKLVMDKVAGDNMNKEVTAKKGELATEKTLNFMAETLYALGAPQNVVNALDGSQKINIVNDKTLPSDAEFDAKTGAINVSQSLVTKVAADQKKLQAQGIINGDGNVLDQNRLNESSIKENTVKIASLVGAHEATHATQQATGVIDQFTHLNNTLRKRILGSAGKTAGTDSFKRLEDAADTASNLLREHMLEYDAYHNQELTQKAAGAPGKVHVTINGNGAALPFEHAVANIAAFETDAPLPYGPDAGIRKSDMAGDAVAGFLGEIAHTGAGAGTTTTGDTTPGGKFPGGKFPGETFPGGKFPGGKFPGETFPGGKFPGGKFPGGKFPGGKFPGGKFPGGKFPGETFPGGKFPGGKFPGETFPGGKFPGDVV